MEIPPELRAAIAEARRQGPEVAQLADEQVAQLIVEAAARQQRAPQGEVDIEGMSAHECGVYGEQLLSTGRWQEGERYFFAQLEKGEREGGGGQYTRGDIYQTLPRHFTECDGEECGLCEGVCSKNLDIIKYMEEYHNRIREFRGRNTVGYGKAHR